MNIERKTECSVTIECPHKQARAAKLVWYAGGTKVDLSAALGGTITLSKPQLLRLITVAEEVVKDLVE